MLPNQPARPISGHTIRQLAGKPGTNITRADGQAAALEKARIANAIRAANTGNALTAAAGPPATMTPATGNDLAMVAAQNRGNPLLGASAPQNALVAAMMPPSAAPAPAPPPTPPMPAPSPQAPTSPNPELDAIAAHVRAQNISPAEMAAASKRSNYIIHALAPLVRQEGPITTAQLVKVGRQAIKDGAATPEQISSFLSRLPNDPSQIKQAVANQLKVSLLASIHSSATQQSNAPTPPAPDGN